MPAGEPEEKKYTVSEIKDLMSFRSCLILPKKKC